MPPCGSPLKSTTKSVPLPVSELNASSVMIREDRGAIPAMRSKTSGGMTIRSSADFAVGQHRFDVAAMAAHPALWLDHAAMRTPAFQGDDAPSHVGVAIGPFQGGEDVRANWTIGIQDHDRALQDRLKGLPDIKPRGLPTWNLPKKAIRCVGHAPRRSSWTYSRKQSGRES
jgi:hypothetical protein